MGQFAKAEALYQRALTINEKFPDSRNLNVARTLNNLASLYKKMGRDDEAKKLRARARPGVMEKEGIQFKAIMTSSVKTRSPLRSRLLSASTTTEKCTCMYIGGIFRANTRSEYIG